MFIRSSKAELKLLISAVGKSKYPQALFDRKGGVLAASAEFWNYWGVTKQEVAQLPSLLLEQISLLSTSPDGKSVELRIPVNNSREPVCVFAEVIKHGLVLSCAVSESTSQRKTSRALKPIINGFSSPIAAFDRDGFFIAFNEPFVSCFGFDSYTEDILEGITVLDLFTFVDSTAMAEIIKAVRNGESLADHQLTLFHGARARDFVALLNYSEINGIPVTMIVLREITPYTTALKTLRAELVETRKQLETRSSIIGFISHEIRNTFNVFLNEILATDEPIAGLGDTRDDAIGRLKLLNSLVNDILEFTKLDSKQITPNHIVFSPRELGYDISRLFSRRVSEKGLDFNVELSPDLPHHVVGDPSRIIEIIINLISNAIKYVDVGGIGLSISHSEPDLILKLKDSGIGLHPTQQRKLFDKFYRTIDASFSATKGAGLGLTITKKLIEVLGGSIRMTSSPGEGTTFVINIPVSVVTDGVQQSSQEYNPLLEKLAAFKAKKPRILVVDDDDASLAYYRVVLTRLGLDFKIASSVSEVFAKMDVSDFDIVITDDQMPGITGSELAEHYRSKNMEILIILLTGLSRSDIKRPELFDFIAFKPVDVSFWRLFSGGEEEESAEKRESLVDDHFRQYIQDPELYEILEEYVEFVSESIATLRDHINEGKISELRSDLHTLKGTSATYGLADISSTAEALERACIEMADVTELRTLLQRLETEIGFALIWLRNNRPVAAK